MAGDRAEEVGRVVGQSARKLKDTADQGQWMGKAGVALKGAGSVYEKTTGRSADSDGKVAGIVAVAGGSVVAAGAALGAISTVATTGLLIGVGTVGTMAYCKANVLRPLTTIQVIFVCASLCLVLPTRDIPFPCSSCG